MPNNGLFEVVIVSQGSNFTRYGVMDNRKPYKKMRYWRGQTANGKRLSWTNDPKKAMTWADETSANWGMKEVALHEYAHLPQRLFIIPFNVVLVASPDVTKEQVQSYLNRALHIGIDYDQEGMGPTPESLVFVDLDSRQMLERTT